MNRLTNCMLILLSSASMIFGQSRGDSNKLPLDSIYQAVKWRNIGPFRGGRSNSACGVIGDPMTYYMGTTGGGLWKTGDAGLTWVNISDGYFKSGSVGAVAVSSSDPHVVYCGMGEHAIRGVMTSSGDGMYRSTDAGKTWQHIGLGESRHIARIVIHPKNPDIVWVAVQGALYDRSEERGIYKTVDGGKNWKRVLFVNNRTGCNELSMDPSNPTILYASMWEHQRLPWQIISGGPGSGLYKSTDGGETWSVIHNGLPEEKGKMAIAVCPSNPEKVYALIESDSNKEKGGLFVSENAGKSWSRISDDHRLIQRAWYYIEVFPDPKNDQVVYVMSAPALKSIDGGKTWEDYSGTHGDYHDLWINPDNPKNMIIVDDGGAAVTFNGGTSWSSQDNMPTAQFYRVNVDNAFPYRIYAGQQDNSTVVIESRALNSYGIDERNWTYSAGGESAFLAFDPDRPTHVLGGSYLGTIDVLDVKAKATTNIMSGPYQYLGRAASDMEYRYNWNAPIVWDQHNNHYYHGSQVIHSTGDMGKNWKIISPDLTRNDKAKQIKGGGPYTVEAVGAENYGTLSYLAVSPNESGVIWAGSDDGLVHITRDGGANWLNVTPKGLAECLINAIEISPHDPATAYIATTRYKFNDHSPGLYKTNDYGKTWQNISKGMAADAFTRVVREDEKRKDLLFAGTERGLYVSWNGGTNWESFQLNLPMTPITDLIIRHDDIVVATSGRAFWILDDLGLIRQYDPLIKNTHLFMPEAAVIVNGGSQLNANNKDFKGTAIKTGVNPANGVVLYYQLPKIADSLHITLEIQDADGRIIRTLSSEKDKNYSKWDGGPPADVTLDKNEGINRFVWDMRHSIMSGVKDVYMEASFRGHKAIPGKYKAILKNGAEHQSVEFEILQNPLYPTDAATYTEYDQVMSLMEGELTKMHDLVNELDKARKQTDALVKKLGDNEKTKPLVSDGKALSKRLKDWDEKMIQRLSKAYDDVENYPNKFTAEYIYLINQTESDIPSVNQASKDRLATLTIQWLALKKEAMELKENAIPAFNAALWNEGIGAIWETE